MISGSSRKNSPTASQPGPTNLERYDVKISVILGQSSRYSTGPFSLSVHRDPERSLPDIVRRNSEFLRARWRCERWRHLGHTPNVGGVFTRLSITVDVRALIIETKVAAVRTLPITTYIGITNGRLARLGSKTRCNVDRLSHLT